MDVFVEREMRAMTSATIPLVRLSLTELAPDILLVAAGTGAAVLMKPSAIRDDLDLEERFDRPAGRERNRQRKLGATIRSGSS